MKHRGMAIRPVGWSKIGEIAFWGSVLWGVGRLVAYFFQFTPYGVRAFSRPLIGTANEDSLTGILLGSLMLFLLTLVGTLLFAAVFSRFRLWWSGLLYGFAWFLLFGACFDWQNWSVNTLSTELTWFLSLGLFVGMGIMAERYDRE